METAWTKVDTKRFKFNWMPIMLKASEVQFTKTTII